MCLLIESMLMGLLGIILGRNFNEKIPKLLIFLIIFTYPIAVFFDPLLPLPYTPDTISSSYVVNTFVFISFVIGLILGKLKSKRGDKNENSTNISF